MSVFTHDVLPTAQEVAFYDHNGWLLTQLFVRDEYLEACRAAAEEVYSASYDQVFSWSAEKGNAGFGQPYVDRAQPRLDAYVSHHKTAVRKVLWSRHLSAYAAALMKATEVRLFRDVLLTMPARLGHNTGLHVDKNYWPTCSSDKLTTAWFSLSDCYEENGCLVVVSGSHRWARTAFVRKLDLEDVDRLQQLYGRERSEVQVVSAPHKRGQVSFHSCTLVHGSRRNLSDQTRQSFATVLQDGDNQYVPPQDQANALLAYFNTNDRIGPKSRDGSPDYRDADFYPMLYRSDSSGGPRT